MGHDGEREQATQRVDAGMVDAIGALERARKLLQAHLDGEVPHALQTEALVLVTEMVRLDNRLEQWLLDWRTQKGIGA